MLPVRTMQSLTTIGESIPCRYGDAMNTGDLHETLARLRAELGRVSSLDENSRRLLQEIMLDAERLRTQPAATPHSRLRRLEALAVQFEANHPTLGAALRELVELLGQAGV